jgi:mono/diheme cytochrome c family protein
MKLLILLGLILNLTYASVVEEYLNTLKQEVQKTDPSFKEFDVKRGEEIFTSKHMGKKGKEISCTSCHGIDLTKSNKNFFTGKVIEPLSPVANPKRFTEVKNIKKWLRRNFNDVYNREGTAQEKGDVVTYILSKDK